MVSGWNAMVVVIKVTVMTVMMMMMTSKNSADTDIDDTLLSLNFIPIKLIYCVQFQS